MPSQEKSPTPGMFGEMQTMFLMPNVLTMYMAAPRLLSRGPSLVGAMFLTWKQSRGTPTPATTSTPSVS